MDEVADTVAGQCEDSALGQSMSSILVSTGGNMKTVSGQL